MDSGSLRLRGHNEKTTYPAIRLGWRHVRRLIVENYIEQRAVDLQSTFCTTGIVNKA
jgi:hypothetical protein